MLNELDITNLALVDHVRISFGAGLNVLTGETGAGKSIVVDAIGLLVGDRADSGMIRAGATSARVEGFFDTAGVDLLELAERAGLSAEDLVSPDDEVLIVSRELSASGRSVCRVNGRGVPVRVLQVIGERLVDIHGQGAHLSLLRVPEHLGLLDRWGDLGGRRRGVQDLRGRLRRLQRELAGLRVDAMELARRADLLNHEIAEISRAHLQPGEEEQLRQAQRVLAGAEQLLQLATRAHVVLSAADEAASARDLLATAGHLLAQISAIDPEAGELGGQAAAIGLQLEDLAANVRRYRDGIDYDPGRLAEVGDRLAAIAALKRKYGASVEDVIAFGAGAEAELAGLLGRDQRIAELAQHEAGLLASLRAAVRDLSGSRRQAAEGLHARVQEEMATLAIPGVFAVEFGPRSAGGDRPAPDAHTDAQAAPPAEDEVEFVLSLNPGEPPRPLVRVASGGETSRVMLAIKSAMAGADPHPTLVFDEIDSGLGGRVGEVVGAKLWRLGRHSQVLAVTHLPQIAAFGDAHHHVAKRVEDGRTVTEVRPVTGDERVAELAEMFGGDPQAGRLQAAALLQRAAKWSTA